MSMSRDEIQRAARITLPSSAKDLKVHTEQGIDRLILLRFTMSAEDQAAFARSAGFEGGLTEGENPFEGMPSYPDWWETEGRAGSVGGERLEAGWSAKVRIDVDAGGGRVVYFEGFTM